MDLPRRSSWLPSCMSTTAVSDLGLRMLQWSRQTCRTSAMPLTCALSAPGTSWHDSPPLVLLRMTPSCLDEFAAAERTPKALPLATVLNVNEDLLTLFRGVNSRA